MVSSRVQLVYQLAIIISQILAYHNYAILVSVYLLSSMKPFFFKECLMQKNVLGVV